MKTTKRLYGANTVLYTSVTVMCPVPFPRLCFAEYKRVREDMENLARANYARHKEAFEEWGEGEPVKAWFDFEGNFCIEYESGKWWHYNDKGEWW